MLATLDVPFARELSAMMGYDDLPYTGEMAEALSAPALLARSLGIEVTRLRVKSFHPVQAILEVIAEHDAGLFVFGPSRDRIGRLRYRRSWPTRASRD